MAKLGSGSLQQKNGWWYFVARNPEGKLKWQALHTSDKSEAERRASIHHGESLIQDDRTQWLRSLVEHGEWAKAELARMESGRSALIITWQNLFETWQQSARKLTNHAYTLSGYESQVNVMLSWAVEKAIATPAELTSSQARAYASERSKTKLSAGRETALFSRIWRNLGLVDVWKGAAVFPTAGKRPDRYRRLTVEEVRRLIKALMTGSDAGRQDGKYVKGTVKPLPDVADLVTVAYHTGLRRGDCARLSTDNIDGDFFRIIPEKTANRKGRPLLIPLQDEAKKLVARLAKNAGDDGLLFPRLADAWLNKCLREAFSRAKIKKNEFGKASFHGLRATFISSMDEAGIPPHVTDAITGHAPAGMHGRYTQPGRDSLMDAVKRAITPLGTW